MFGRASFVSVRITPEKKSASVLAAAKAGLAELLSRFGCAERTPRPRRRRVYFKAPAPARVAREKRSPKPLPSWGFRVVMDRQEFTGEAMGRTKSEARARLKSHLAFLFDRRVRRLPIGAALWPV